MLCFLCSARPWLFAAGRTGPAAPGNERARLHLALTRSFERWALTWAEHVEEEMEMKQMEMKQKLKRAAMKMLQGALTRSFERQQHDRTPLEPKHKQNQNDHKTHIHLIPI